MRQRICVAGAAMAAVPLALAQCPPQRITSPTPWETGRFGSSVAIVGDVAVVSDPTDHTFCPVFTCSSGAVHVFRRDGGAWTAEQTLFSSAIAPYDSFGLGMDFDGRRIAAGATGDDTAAPDAGAVYIFEHDGAAWRETGVALPVETRYRETFASVVALQGDTLVVGARGWIVGTIKPGAAFVYREVDGRWEFVQELIPPDMRHGAWFGNAIAIDGEWLLLGARGDEEGGHNAGAAYLYRQQPDGSYGWEAKFLAPGDPWNQNFGADVAIAGNRMLVGAANGPDSLSGRGAVYVYDRSGGEWRHAATLEHEDPVEADALGASVSLHGDLVVAGAPRQGPGIAVGAAYTFQRQPDGSWRQVAKLVSETTTFEYGRSVSTDGVTALVGARTELVPGGAGAAHIFDLACLLCRADLDGDGELTFFDFLAFQTLFAAGDLRADFDGDGELTFFDFLAFQNEFAAGCD